MNDTNLQLLSLDCTIDKVNVVDLRVPTSDTLLGSDPFHKKPNYSAVLTTIETNSGYHGISVAFTAGAGNDWIAYGVKDLAQLITGMNVSSFVNDPGTFFKHLIDHHQLRWLADGVNRMAIGCIVNAMWDLWGKLVAKPLWKLLVDLPPKKIVQCIDWRYHQDALTPDEAVEILNNNLSKKESRENSLIEKGPKAYSTAGWLGLTDEQIIETVNDVKASGLDCFKMKVGQDVDFDKKRLSFIRSVIGNEAKLMLDANQVWGVDEAISHMEQLVDFNPIWIEEPTARDDVLGFVKISKSLEKYGIGVAAGEQVPSPVIFKQLITSGAIQFCQIDATRLGGVNDVLAVILMAAKYDIPVCPHGGGIGLCNMIQHYALWDQISVAGHSNTQVVEYLNFLQEDVFLQPIQISNGAYVAPSIPGWGLEMYPEFVEEHTYPTGSIWKERVESGGITFLA
ncbi:mandelate racemase/muconate lactonizing enzyme domain-containing protein [Candidatus Poribacteria bacterium]|nr:mandelate racemase/muconate lactonizing enzyme domain-containing protein [Candidatus Poribacteria bacterium]